MRNLEEFYKSLESARGKATADAVRDFTGIYTDGIYKWLAGLWDGEIGGFYYSNSARDTDGYLPDIESTAQAIGNLEVSGIISSPRDLPESMQKKIIAFLQGLQDESNGYFYHPQWKEMMLADPMRYTSRRARDLHNAVNLLKELGAAPLYPTATERIKATAGESEKKDIATPEHLSSKEKFLDYLESLNINNDSYSVGHRISAQAIEINAAGLTDVAYEFLNSKQYDNGLWEKELSYRASNGLMKISCGYRTLKRPFPRMEKAFRASLDIALSDLPMNQGITCVYNPPFTILNLLQTMQELGDTEGLGAAKKALYEDAPALLYRTREKVLMYRKEDYSFSYCFTSSSSTSQGCPAAVPGSNEGDVNANSLASGSRTRTYKILDIDHPKIFCEDDSRKFFDLIGEN